MNTVNFDFVSSPETRPVFEGIEPGTRVRFEVEALVQELGDTSGILVIESLSEPELISPEDIEEEMEEEAEEATEMPEIVAQDIPNVENLQI